MKKFRFLTWLTLAAGIAVTGTSTLSAQDWHDVHRDRQDVRSDYRDIDHDYDRVSRMRADIAGDQARLNEDIRCGRSGAATRDAQDLARDQRTLNAQDLARDQGTLNAQVRDVRHDWR